MQPSEKAGEPSMEDILASIRKIIADDPSAMAANGKHPAPAPPIPASPVSPSLGFPTPSRVGTAATAQPPMPALHLPPAPQQPPPPAGMSSLEQELADLLREPVEVPPAARPVPAPPAPPSGSSTSGSGPNGASSSGPSGLTAWLRGKPKAEPLQAERVRPEPSIEAAGAAKLEPEITPFLPDAVPPHEAAISAMIAAAPSHPPASDPQPVAPQSVVAPTNSATVPERGPEAKSGDAPVSMQAILERLNAPVGPGPGVVIKPPVPGPVKSRSFTASPAVSGQTVEASDTAVAPANRPVGEASLPASAGLEKAVSTAAPTPAPAPPVGGSSPALEKPATVITADAVKVIAEAAAAAPAVDEPVRVEPVVIPPPIEAISAPVAQAEATVAPVLAIAPAPQPAQPAAPLTEAAPSAPVATTSTATEVPPAAPVPVLEDMLAEAMRPMVRQWLDENMREALEKALRAEMSESLLSVLDKMKAGGKP